MVVVVIFVPQGGFRRGEGAFIQGKAARESMNGMGLAARDG